MDVRYKRIQRVLFYIMLGNFLVATIKIVLGSSCGSHSLFADGIHSLTDGSANIVGAIGIWFSAKPIDKQHPYGHRKFEILASLAIGVMLIVMAIELLLGAVSSLKMQNIPNIDVVDVLMLMLTICVNILISSIEFHCGKKLESSVLVADAIHTRSDILVSGTVLSGMIGMALGLPFWIDFVISIGVVIVIFMSAFEIMKNCIDILVDTAMVDGNEVREILMNLPEVWDVHKIRSRGDKKQIFIDLHVIISPEEDVIFSHKISHDVESLLKKHYGENTQVCVHVEPDDGLHN